MTRADSDKQRQFIDELKSAGVNHQLMLGDNGKQYVKWREEDNAAVKKVEVALFGEPIPEERSIQFDGTLNDEFKSWLAANSIAFETRMSNGREYVIWNADDYLKIKTWKHFPKSYFEQLQSSNITVKSDARALP